MNSEHPHLEHLSTGALSSKGSTGRSSSRARITSSHFLQYQTGNGIPKGSWREIHQSQARPFTQLSYLFFICLGCHSNSLPQASILSFRSKYLINHCLEWINSTVVPHLSWTLTKCFIGFCPLSNSFFLRSTIICLRAFSIFIPSYFPDNLVIKPFLSIASFIGNLCAFCHSISAWSPKVQHITIPVPFSGSALWSSKIGTSKSNKGTFAFLPFNFLKRLSSGW